MAQAPPLPQPAWSRPVGRDAWISLAAYGAGEAHEAHRHDRAQLTVQLAGSLEEKQEARGFEIHGAAVGFKPAGILHADRWGNAGALLFTLSARGEAEHGLFAGRDAGWKRTGAAPELGRLIARLGPASEAECGEILPDIAALCCAISGANARAGSPPRWLARVREALCDDPGASPIAELAQAEGVHRIYLARAFRRHFGASPSEFRRTQMAARLVAALARSDEPLAECALACGFFDQSHAVRVLKGETGLGLAQLRRLLGGREVPSVQDRAARAA